MADELEAQLNEPSEIEGRIKKLSKTTSEAQAARDVAEKAREEAEAKAAEAERKTNFYKDFSKISSEYKDAPEFADEIEAKVMQGYTPKDATVSVLMEKGKFSPTQTIERQQVAGGSASNNISIGGSKGTNEMTQAERRAALVAAEGRGDIGIN